MTTTEDAAINLDCEPASQLRARLKAGGLKGGQRKYIQLKLKSIDLRLRGMVNDAVAVEREMDKVYASMPAQLRW